MCVDPAVRTTMIVNMGKFVIITPEYASTHVMNKDLARVDTFVMNGVKFVFANALEMKIAKRDTNVTLIEEFV